VRSEDGGESGPPRAACNQEGRQKWGDNGKNGGKNGKMGVIKEGIRYLTTFGGGKIAVRPGRR